MGLTKPRAAQIYDIDYKQATRVLTTSNITLSGGAPSQVDGVNLSLDDRVLVIGQNTQAQNGIYFVDMLGTGSNGTWVRTGDTDITGELLAGTIVMVTEGLIYADTQWKLVTDDPIVIGTTPLIFEQNSAFAFGNVYANGTAVLASSVGDVLTLTAGNNISISGNNTSKTVTIGVTGISLTSIANGTSNVNVVSSGGNVTVGVDGTSNVAVFSSSGLAVTGNITGGNILTGGQLISTQTGSSSTGAGQVYLNGATNNRIDWNTEGVAAPAFTTRSAGTKLLMYPAISGNQVDYAMGINAATLWSSVPLNSPDFYFKWYGGQTEVASLSGAGAFSVTGNISAVGNISGGNILGNGSGLSGINAFSNIAVTGSNSAVADSIADTLTLTAGIGIAITCDATTDTITIAATGGSATFLDGADFGTVTELVTASDDLGLVTAAVEAESDLGSIVTSGVFFPDLLVVNDTVDFQLGGGSNGQYLGTYGNGTIFWQSLSSAPLTGNMVGNINGNTYSITNLATLGVTGNSTVGNLSAGGNITGSYIFGNGSQLSGIDATSIQSGTSNVRVTSSGGNVSVGIGGTSNVAVFSTSGVTVTGGIINGNANGVGNIGSSTTYFNTVFAKATSAQYADLAEMYVADASYTPGTVVVFGGDKEVTISTVECDHRVAGVISTNPSYLMNSGLTAEHTVAVALTGRVPTKVLGPVVKGDLMISAPGGYARACNQPGFGTIIGKSLENLTQAEGVIEIVVGAR